MKKLHESIQFYFSKLKKPSTSPPNNPIIKPSSSSSSSSYYSTCRILPRCRKPRTTSFTYEREPPSSSSSTSSSSTSSSSSENSIVSSPNFGFLYRDGGCWECRILVPEELVWQSAMAVVRSSVNPYEDFKRSMEEMVVARGEERLDWEFMESLLFSYLNLNEETSHQYIVRAFSDLVTAASSMASSEGGGKEEDEVDRQPFPLTGLTN